MLAKGLEAGKGVVLESAVKVADSAKSVPFEDQTAKEA
jgi:hypothetical protein